MKVYLEPPQGLSKAMSRVANALRIHCPLPIVRYEQEADLVILHVIGMTGLHEKLHQIKKRNQQYAILQYCLRTTERPDTNSWVEIWRNAAAVWSYYDLNAAMANDGVPFKLQNFWYSQLGADIGVFLQSNFGPREYTICTSGYVAETEGVSEAFDAVVKVKGRQFHLGPPLIKHHLIDSKVNIPDSILVGFLNNCQFVAGLRRVEGFELPAVEGLLCGARPIVFDRPHYRQWFGSLAEYVEEGSYETLVEDLQALFVEGPRTVTREEMERARQLYDWAPLCWGFWGTVRNTIGVLHA